MDVYHSWELVCVHLNLVQSILKQLVITLKIRFVTLTYSSVCRCLQIYIQAAVCRVAANCIFYEWWVKRSLKPFTPTAGQALPPAQSWLCSDIHWESWSGVCIPSIWLPAETWSSAPPSQFWGPRPVHLVPVQVEQPQCRAATHTLLPFWGRCS